MPSTEDIVQNLGNYTAGVVDGDDEQQVPIVQVPMPGLRRPGPADNRNVPAKPVMHQSKLSELWHRYSPDKDINFRVKLNKLWPTSYPGEAGWMQTFTQPIDEETIRGLCPDGGQFQVVVLGSNPRTGDAGAVKEAVTVNIAADPAKKNKEGRRGLLDGLDDEDALSLYGRRGRYHQPPPPQQPPPPPQPDTSATTLAFQTLRDVLGSTTSGKDQMISQLRDLLEKPGRGGLDPSTVQSLIDANEAQKAAVQARHESQLTELREQANRDLERATARLERQLEDERAIRARVEEDTRRREDNMRERYEREVTQLRTTLEDERKEGRRLLERSEDKARDEYKRLADSHAEELKRIRYELESRVALAEKSKEDSIKLLERSKEEALAVERERAKIMVEQISNNAKLQVDSTMRQAETSTEHVKQLTELSLKTSEIKEEAFRRALEDKAEREKEARIRAEEDARRYRDKAEEAIDPISSISKIKEMADTVGMMFGGGGHEEIVPHTEDSSFLDKAERLLNSRFGQRVGEVAGAILGGIAQKAQQPPQPPPQPQYQPRQFQQPQQVPVSSAPPPRQAPAAPYRAPQPPPVQPMPQQQPRPQPQPNPQGLEQQAAEALFGGGSAEPTPRQAEPQGVPAQEITDNPVLRVKVWVSAIEDHVEAGTDPVKIVESIEHDLPVEVVMALAQEPIESLIMQMKGLGVETRGIIDSPRGLEFMRAVQQGLIARMQAPPVS